jgi:hypothetical protein
MLWQVMSFYLWILFALQEIFFVSIFSTSSEIIGRLKKVRTDGQGTNLSKTTVTCNVLVKLLVRCWMVFPTLCKSYILRISLLTSNVLVLVSDFCVSFSFRYRWAQFTRSLITKQSRRVELAHNRRTPDN